MSSTAKIIIAIIILAVAGGAYYWSMNSNSSPVVTQQSATTTNPSQANAMSGNSNDTSDGTIIQGSTAIDAQMSNLDSDNAQMNSTDQPVSQSY